MSKKSSKISLYDRCLNGIERVGNSLPHPIALFAILALAVILLSAVCAAFDVSATGELVSGGELKETTVSAEPILSRMAENTLCRKRICAPRRERQISIIRLSKQRTLLKTQEGFLLGI